MTNADLVSVAHSADQLDARALDVPCTRPQGWYTATNAEPKPANDSEP